MHIVLHSLDHNEILVNQSLAQQPLDLGMYKAVGCNSHEEFIRTGNAHVAVLRHHGLKDGMNVYDLGCGSGRTAQALMRSGWKGHYKGVDIVTALVNYLKSNCAGYDAVVHKEINIASEDDSIDMVFHWSVFTHLYIEECYLYLQDTMRTLKPGGRLVFSFLELENEAHRKIFMNRVATFKGATAWSHLDTFIHRDWIRTWAAEIGFTAPKFTDGTDSTNHPSFWQTVASMDKPMTSL